MTKNFVFSYDNLHENDLNKVAKDVLSQMVKKNLHIMLLRGDLGAGKTTFTKKIAEELNVTEKVSSPTFVIMKEYETSGILGFNKMVHIDAYRLKNHDDLRVFDLKDVLRQSDVLFIIEWPDKLDFKFEKALLIDIYLVCENKRNMKIKILNDM